MAIAVSIVGKYDGKDIARAQRELDALARQAGVTQSRTSALGASMKSMLGPALIGAGVAAGALAVKIGVDGVKAAIDDEASVSRLSQTMKNLGVANKEAGVEKMIDDLQFQTGVADDELRPAMDRLLRATDSVSESQRLLGLTLDISAAKGKDAATVANVLGRAAEGNVTSLGKLGVGLDKNTLKTSSYRDIIEKLTNDFQGSAARAADTWEGRLKRLDVATGELEEALGTGFLDGFSDGLGGAQDGTDGLVDALRDARPQAEALGKALGGVAASLVDIGKAAGGFVGWLDSLDVTLPLTNTRISILTGSIQLLTSAWRELLVLKGDAPQNPERVADYAERDKAMAKWSKQHPNATIDERFNFSKNWFAKNSAAAKQATADAMDFGPSTFTGGKGAGAQAKKATDEISAHWQGVLRDAGLKLAAFADGDAAGFGQAGLNLVNKLIEGVTVKGSPKTTKAVQDMLGKALDAVSSKYEDAVNFGKSISDGILQGLDIGDAASGWQDRQDAVKAALKDLNDAQKTLTAESTQAERDRVTELQGIYQKAQEDAAKGGATIIDAFVIQANKAGEFATKLQALLKAGLNETTWTQIAGLSAEQGVKVIDAYYDGNLQENIRRTNEAVGAVDSVSKQVGDQAIKTFKLAGLETALSFLEAMTKALTAGSTRKGLNDAIASIRRDMDSILNPAAGSPGAASFVPLPTSADGLAPIDWSTPDNKAILDQNRWAYENLPLFADGGVAMGPTPGIFGEAGPEALIPLDRLRDVGGGGTTNTYYITVSVAAGADPRLAGQAVIEQIDAFERANGRVFARAPQ